MKHDLGQESTHKESIFWWMIENKTKQKTIVCSQESSEKEQDRKQKQEWGIFLSGRCRFIFRWELIFPRSFLLPIFCLHCGFESGPEIEFSDCFRPGEQPPSCVLSPQHLSKEARGTFSITEAVRSIPAPNCGIH